MAEGKQLFRPGPMRLRPSAWSTTGHQMENPENNKMDSRELKEKYGPRG